jgi:tetratricopeptide (TPR) repeat protein
MPLMRLNAAEAYENAAKEGASWPRTQQERDQRLTPTARPRFTPSFVIDRDQKIFTIGSCFARNIERQLIAEGCNVAAAQFDIPAAERDCNSIESLLNRFVCFSILNEFRWALSPEHPFPKESLVELRPGRWFDMNNVHEISPSSLERVMARRERVTAYMKRVAEADVIVMTLGLAEAWFDRHAGCYANVAPHRSVRDSQPDRFEFHLLDYNEIVACLDELHEIVKRYGKPEARFLVTVSPVALGTSFSGRDALTANTYSKAVQRAAIEQFALKHENVDYFPSFESVTLSDRRFAWREDQAHASDEIVRLNVLRMARAYLRDSRPQDEVEEIQRAYELVEKGKALSAAGDHAGALSLMGEAVRLTPNEPAVRLHYANFLLAARDFNEAIVQALAVTSGATPPKRAHDVLGRAYAGAGQHGLAYGAYLKELAATPLRPGLLLRLATTCEHLDKFDEGLNHINTAINQLGSKHPQLPIFEAIRDRLEAATVNAA